MKMKSNLNNLFYLLIFIFFISCEKSFRKELNETNFNEILIKKNDSLVLLGQDKNVILLNGEYLERAKKGKYVEGEVLCYINIGNIASIVGQYKVAFSYLNKARLKLQSIDNPMLSAKLNMEYSRLNALLYLPENTYLYSIRAMGYLRKIDKRQKQIYALDRAYLLRAEYLNLKSMCDSALFYGRQALKISNDPTSRILMSKYHLSYNKKSDSSVIYLQQAENLLKQDDIETVSHALFNLTYGEYYSEKKNYKKAIGYYKEAARIYTKTKRYRNVPIVYYAIADLYKKLNDTVQQRTYFEKQSVTKQNLEESRNEALNLSIKQALLECKEKTNSHIDQLYIYLFVLLLCILIVSSISYTKFKKKHEKNVELARVNYKLSLTIKENLFEDLIVLVKNNDPSFLSRYEEVYPEFTKRILLINPNLSTGDLAFCAMLSLNFSSKDIAKYTFVQHKSIQQKKYRIRVKLSLSSNENLYVFFKSINNN
ncbi:hypothetical protein [Chryseobacterium sp.]|uniref:hypothetical protein n=1 Tax=Chryseobacterium sp. TaxID=1871047 RepID=UPI00289B1168|nr:hypothetical protein [Chryseobacterium sp.]